MISQKSIDIIKATAPAVVAAGPTLIEHFYQRMLWHNPELNNIFNSSHQRSGEQSKTLFNALCAYAQNIENLEVLLPAVEKIAQKHTSLGVSADQYPIIGAHLLATIREQITDDQSVLDAWAKAYDLLANIFIRREAAIYQENQEKQGGWRGIREFILTEKIQESASITSFIFKPADGGMVSTYKPGQYLGIYVHPDHCQYQEIRQYSLSSMPRSDSYRISVKCEAQGTVSNYLHHQILVGDRIQLSPPAGDFFLDVPASTPVTLISAGVGLTPMLSMLESLTAHQASVYWWHATENSQQHAFKDTVSTLAKQYPHIHQTTWYRAPLVHDRLLEDFDYDGLMNIKQAASESIDPAMQYYFCGPIGFMQQVTKQLLVLGVQKDALHYECFGPHATV